MRILYLESQENKFLIEINYKHILIAIFLSLYIIINIVKPNKRRSTNNEILYYSNEIFYKGKKVLKYKLINQYLSKISDEYISDKIEEKIRFNKYYNLAIYSNNLNTKYILRAKLLKEISKLKNHTITKINTFYLSHNYNFGNSLIALNNAIFFCEVIECHKIILNQPISKRRWFFGKEIYIKQLNITIIQESNVNCKENNILCLSEISWDIFYPMIIIPKVRIQLIKNEILSNLQYINIDPDDLYIHIRGGNIFNLYPLKYYAQPPLCFYEKVINEKKFKNIYIISMDTSNIVINNLTTKYKNIIYKQNNLVHDISLLCQAYNIVLSISSFIISAIKLNDNLKEIWEYDIMRLSEKFLFLHHHLYKFNIGYIINTMKPSENYLSKMFSWRRTNEQMKLMLEADCPFNFSITNPNNFQ